jgi:acyl-CoA synthetase (AMP-forming)/AMP-acid ligase II
MRNLTIPALLTHRANYDGDRDAVVTPDQSMTYRDLERQSEALACELVSEGVSKGSRVGLLMENGVAWVALAMAITRVGGVLVPLSTLLRSSELSMQLRQASVSHLIMSSGFRGRDYVADLSEIATGYRGPGQPMDRSVELPALRRVWCLEELGHPSSRADSDAGRVVVAELGRVVRPSDDLVIIFTSGSRGLPKGVIHTHGSAVRATGAGLDVRCIGPGDRLYIPMPMFWMGGFGGGVLSAIVAGATLLTEAISDPSTTLPFLERERVTLFRGWPDQAERLARHPAFAETDLSTLRPGSLQGVLPEGSRSAPGARANLFGMTESFGPYSGYRLDQDLPRAKWGSCGRPLPGVEVRIVDPESGNPLEVGEAGVIEIRGPNMMRGIIGRSREAVFRVDGFYPTGDLGSLDSDGYLYFLGRRDDMFKVRGASVYPSEVEATIGSLLGVTGVFVTSVDGPAGAEVGAAVQLADGSGFGIDNLLTATKTQLSAYKVPTVWMILEPGSDVPRMPTGKVDKGALQTLLREHGTSTSRAAG